MSDFILNNIKKCVLSANKKGVESYLDQFKKKEEYEILPWSDELFWRIIGEYKVYGGEITHQMDIMINTLGLDASKFLGECLEVINKGIMINILSSKFLEERLKITNKDNFEFLQLLLKHYSTQMIRLPEMKDLFHHVVNLKLIRKILLLLYKYGYKESCTEQCESINHEIYKDIRMRNVFFQMMRFGRLLRNSKNRIESTFILRIILQYALNIKKEPIMHLCMEYALSKDLKTWNSKVKYDLLREMKNAN